MVNLLSEKYIRIADSYGGNQSWFEDQVFSQGDEISYGGCGLIAMADLLLYLSLTDSRVAESLPSLVVPSQLSQATYDFFVKSLYFQYLQPWRNPLFTPKRYRKESDFVLGIQGWQLRRGLNRYFKKNKLNKKATFHSLKKNSDQLSALIQRELAKDQPVPLMIGPSQDMFPRALRFLGRTRGVPAKLLSNPHSQTEIIISHWVTVTKYEKNSITGNEQISVSSWGKIYQIDLSVFLKDSDWFSGIILVR